MSHNRQSGETPETVHVWICRIIGSTHESTVFCSRKRARRWVRARLGSSGEWINRDWKDVYDCDGQDTGIVEFATIDDAVGIVVEDQ